MCVCVCLRCLWKENSPPCLLLEHDFKDDRLTLGGKNQVIHQLKYDFRISKKNMPYAIAGDQQTKEADKNFGWIGAI